MARILLVCLAITVAAGIRAPVAISATPLTVSKTADTADGACDSDCSLREAIIAANASPGLDTINFDISGPGPHSILLAEQLPTITDPVIIDGESEPDFAGTPRIELTGAFTPPGVGLWITGGGSTIRGLVINNFSGDGIAITGNGGNRIEGNFIGTDVTGTTALGNFARGVGILGSSDNIVGGKESGKRNLISGNGFANVDINAYPTAAASRNVIQGNYIGVDVTGTKPLEDAPYAVGIWIGGGSDNLIGGSVPGAGNLISGNGEGVRVQDGSRNRIVGNLIGTDANGSQPVANGTGVDIMDSSENAVGGASAGERNTISGNTNDGVVLTQSGSVFPVTTENPVQGNFIGVDASGMSALGNGGNGVTIRLSASNVIGGTAPGAGNVISANGRYGLELAFTSTNNFVQGNYIGTNAAGDQDLGNTRGGVAAGPATPSSPNMIGPGNIISGNGGSGVLVSEWVKVQGNLIGTSADGTGDLGNDKHGVHVDWGARNNEIGGLASGDGNRIAFNGEAGIALTYGALGNNAIHGNMIHSNQGLGIDILADGPTLNDAGDADAGPNGLQNFPVVSEAIATAIGTDITGVLDAEPDGTYIVEFLVSNTCDATGYGEGAVFLDRMSLSTGPSQTTFSKNLPVTLPIGSFVTATATGADGNSSEFSQCAQVCAPQDLDCDGLSTGSDNCPTVSNPEQDDSDGDLAGDACDTPGSGNVDCNMAVNTVDALKVLRHTAGLPVTQNEPCLDIGQPRDLPPPNDWKMGDVDCSGTVNAVDALKILRAVIGLSVAMPEGCPAIVGP